jgi:hypothetical protein
MSGDVPKSTPPTPDLREKVKRWLGEQGYPTEFKAANICRIHGFRVWQGFHVRDEKTEVPREIDVIASADYGANNFIIRVEHVLECKWSKDKPWIVFTSPSGHMAPSACTAQTIGNTLGEAAIWTVAGDPRLHSLDFFSTPERPGFGGRQAFSKGLDQFYSAVAAISELSYLLAKRSDTKSRPPTMTKIAILTFPLVVVEGLLYEAYFDEKDNDIQLVARDRIRCHWRGASSGVFNTTLDIVTLDHLDQFMQMRAAEMEMFLSLLGETVLRIEKCFKEQSLRSLSISRGPRGMLGLPYLFQELHMLDEVKRLSKSRRKKSKTQKKREKAS